LLQVKTNLTTSAKLTKTIFFDRKIFRKNSPKNRKRFKRTSPKKCNPQRNEKLHCSGKPPNWQLRSCSCYSWTPVHSDESCMKPQKDKTTLKASTAPDERKGEFLAHSSTVYFSRALQKSSWTWHGSWNIPSFPGLRSTELHMFIYHSWDYVRLRREHSASRFKAALRCCCFLARYNTVVRFNTVVRYNTVIRFNTVVLYRTVLRYNTVD